MVEVAIDATVAWHLHKKLLGRSQLERVPNAASLIESLLLPSCHLGATLTLVTVPETSGLPPRFREVADTVIGDVAGIVQDVIQHSFAGY